MRSIAFLVTACVVAVAHGYELRMWTQASSDKQFEGRMIDRSYDGKKVRVETPSGKKYWLELEKLTEEDQKHAKEWVQRINFLDLQFKGARKNKGKTIEVTANAGSQDIEVRSYWQKGGKQPSGYPIINKVLAGNKETFEVIVGNEYSIQVYVGERMVEEETWNKKNQ